MSRLPILVDAYFTALFGGLPGGSGLTELSGGIHEVKDQGVQADGIRDLSGRLVAPAATPLTGPDDVDSVSR